MLLGYMDIARMVILVQRVEEEKLNYGEKFKKKV